MERARRVNAVPSPAESLVPLALVHVHADLHHGRGLKALVALARKGARDVNAGPIAAHAVHDVALVDVHALHTMFIQGIAKKMNKKGVITNRYLTSTSFS